VLRERGRADREDDSCGDAGDADERTSGRGRERRMEIGIP